MPMPCPPISDMLAGYSTLSVRHLICDPGSSIAFVAGAVARKISISHLSAGSFFRLSFPLQLTHPPTRSLSGTTSYMRSPTGAALLAKGLACARCKTRKTRCDGGKPACGACLRSARFKHRPLDEVVCHYGDPLDDTKSQVTQRSKLKTGGPHELLRVEHAFSRVNGVERLVLYFDVFFLRFVLDFVPVLLVLGQRLRHGRVFGPYSDHRCGQKSIPAAPAPPLRNLSKPRVTVVDFGAVVVVDSQFDRSHPTDTQTRYVDEAWNETITGIAGLPLCWRVVLARH
ncbi:BQ2448_6067 [Microbotryum intermedium]|uniref:BQ2448_6067 protein n=1 Tax=Microbotryum intermedium TaxID=269621 RepID=A0A238FK60_9BASI|nr:BQ2448_6067 [Microbotryum intermedium]